MPNPKHTLFSGDWLDVIREEDREYMVRRICTGVAILIAINDQGELVLTEQYRVPAHSRVLELPAGMAGDELGKEHESTKQAAKRELWEETGYESESLLQVAQGPISSGISSEVMTFFYTDKIRKTGKGGGNESEDITVHEVPLTEIERYIAKQAAQGVLIDPKLYIGIHFARHYHCQC